METLTITMKAPEGFDAETIRLHMQTMARLHLRHICGFMDETRYQRFKFAIEDALKDAKINA